MRIGFDGKRAVQNYTGLGNYSRYLLDILCRTAPQNEYMLYAPKPRANDRLKLLLQRHPMLQMVYPALSRWRRMSALWRVWGIWRQLRGDRIVLYHGLSNELPLSIRRSGVKSVVTIHDLIFLRFPLYYKPIDRAIYTYKFRKACEHADRIVAISECTKRDIIHYFHIPEEKIEVIYQGCDPAFAVSLPESKKKEVVELYQLPLRYILHVGSIEERKNMMEAVEALALMKHTELHLVIIGRRTPYTARIEQLVKERHLEKRVHLLHGIPFAHLPAIYQSAACFVYPSRYEGFGIPILEALHSGIPVVAATGSCLEEAGGPDSIYVSPDSPSSMAEAFDALMDDEALCRRMVSGGRRYAARFNEKAIASAYLRLYKEVSSSIG